MFPAHMWVAAFRGVLAFLFLPCLLKSQSSLPEPLHGAASVAKSNQALQITIVEGDGVTNNIRQRVTREPVVEVRDQNNRPVAGALVTFLLPGNGPGGVFPGGAKVLRVATNSAGRAAASGLQANQAVGGFKISITASFQGQTSAAIVTQTNVAAVAGGAAAAGGTVAGASTGAATGGASGLSAASIGLIAGGIAAGGAVAAKVASGGNASASAQVVPSATIGAPGTPVFGPAAFSGDRGRLVAMPLSSRTASLPIPATTASAGFDQTSTARTAFIAAATAGAAAGTWWYLAHRGARHKISLSPRHIAFGEVVVGRSAPAVISLENRSRADVSVESIRLPGVQLRIQQRHQVPFVVRAGATTIIPVLFTPRIAGNLEASIVIALGDSIQGRSRQLSVEVTATALASEVAVRR